MKVRARVKAPEYLPEWAKCCPEMIDEVQRHVGMVFTVDLGVLTPSNSCSCRFCGHRTIDPGPYFIGLCYVAILDLDEGPMEQTV